MAADIGDAAALHDQDRVGRDKGRQPVRNDDQSPAAPDTGEIVGYDRFALGIKRAGCFVENENTRVDNQRPRNCQPLALTT